MYSTHDMIIVEDIKTRQVIRLNDSLEVTEALLDKLRYNDFPSTVIFDKKDIYDQILNLNVINQWGLDDWIKGFRARPYLTIQGNKMCAYLMNAQKRESITLRQYLC